ncbi:MULTISPECIES: DUF4190 domain-containing protein [Kocuria]|uniref:DUF4190 domain-containing protein n=1 Tax=Kocuria TaxID=57493 RepID=UPI0026E0ABA7|nr:DUF4190 domain-containing protein [Kocuria sp.]MDO5368275.1 DUF4190 domain-containing protein [Kocuria sp.]
MSSTHSSSNDPTQYRDSSQEYVPHGGAPGRNPTVPANQVSPYGQPPGRWEYVPASPQDAQQQVQAAKSAETSLVLGIIGVVMLPVLAPFALWQAYKSEKLGGRATAGKVLGWVGVALLILGVLWLIAVFAFFGLMMNELDSVTRSSL